VGAGTAGNLGLYISTLQGARLLVAARPPISWGMQRPRAKEPMLKTTMQKADPPSPPEDERHIEQQQADDRRQKDQTEKIERDRADAAGRQAREGT
jgi:hypothetical protein